MPNQIINPSPKIDWTNLAERISKADKIKWPMSHPRIPTCRRCGKDGPGAGLLFCFDGRADKTEDELIEWGEYYGTWTISINRVGNATWVRSA